MPRCSQADTMVVNTVAANTVVVNTMVRTAAFALMFVCAANPAARAQQPAATAGKPATATTSETPAQPAPSKPEPESGTPATVIDNRQIESVLGRSVLSPTGDDLGRITDLLVDRKGKLRAAVIDFGGFFGVGSRKIAVDWHSLHFTRDSKTNTIVADLPNSQLRVAPIYKEDEPVVVLGRPSAAEGASTSDGTAKPADTNGAEMKPAPSVAPASPPEPAAK